MNRPTVLVDIDGVLADFNAGTFEYVREKYPDVEIPSILKFRVHHNFDDQALRKEIKAIHNQQNFFRNLPLMDGALEGWQKIIDLGYRPRICSSPLVTNVWCETEKRDWLREHFGESVANDALITKDKYLQQGIALIDDRTDLHNAAQAPWQQILFSAPYNQDFDTHYRLNGWHDPQLESLLSRINSSAV